MNENPPTLASQLTRRYLSRLIAHPKGRAHLLTQLADAEASGEGAVFDRLLAKVEDPQIQKLIKRHAADEIRHAEMFRACAARHGVDADAIPAELRLIDRLDVATGHLLDRGIRGPEDVMHAYVLLQVIEERAITQFALFESIFREIDPETADVLAEIARDEERHLKYCHAIARRYAPDAQTHAAALRHFRDIEARCFSENSRANLRWLLDRRYVQINAAERVLWLGLAELQEWTGKEERTPYWDAPPPRSSAKTVAADAALSAAA